MATAHSTPRASGRRTKAHRIPTAWLKRYVTERGLAPDVGTLKRIEVERDATPTVAFRIYFEEVAPAPVRSALRNAYRQQVSRDRKAKEGETLRNELERAKAAAGSDADVLIDPRPFVKAARPLLRTMAAEVKKSYAVYSPATLQDQIHKLQRLIDALESGAPLRNDQPSPAITENVRREVEAIVKQLPAATRRKLSEVFERDLFEARLVIAAELERRYEGRVPREPTAADLVELLPSGAETVSALLDTLAPADLDALRNAFAERDRAILEFNRKLSQRPLRNGEEG